MQRSGLSGDLARGGQIRQRAHLLGETRLLLKKLGLHRVQLNLTIGLEHASGETDRDRDQHDGGRRAQW